MTPDAAGVVTDGVRLPQAVLVKRSGGVFIFNGALSFTSCRSLLESGPIRVLRGQANGVDSGS
jgi:hypothetical protein